MLVKEVISPERTQADVECYYASDPDWDLGSLSTDWPEWMIIIGCVGLIAAYFVGFW